MALNSQPSHTLSQCREEGAHSYWSVSCFWVVHNIFWSVQPGRTQVMKVRFLLPCCGQIANVKAKDEWLSNSSFKEKHNFHLIPSQLHTTFSVLSRFTVFTWVFFFFLIELTEMSLAAAPLGEWIPSGLTRGGKKNINGCTCSKESLRKADRNTAR